LINKAYLAASASAIGLMVSAAPVLAQSSAGANADAAAASPGQASTADAQPNVLEKVVVTGQTTAGRKLLTATSDVNVMSEKDIDEKAPRNLESLFEMVPGVFVENSAGSVDNNIEVRGLPGGGQAGVGWQIDGLGENYSSLDLSIDHAEAVRGGASTVLAVGASGVLMNLITKKPNFHEYEAEFKVGGASFGEKRADFYVSGPIAKDLAFNASGYVDANKGQRDSVYTYHTFHATGSLAYKLPDNGMIQLTVRRNVQNDPYYADMPFQVVNGKFQAVPGLDTQYGNMNGSAFGNIQVPSTYVNNPSGLTTFSTAQSSHDENNSVRLDVDLPIQQHLTFHSKSSFNRSEHDRNYIFPGGYAGSGGLAPAANYLDMNSAGSYGGFGGNAPWPVGPALNAALNHFGAGNVAQFGIQNLQTGVVTPASNTAALTGLNGNGLLQMSTLYLTHSTDNRFQTNDFVTYDQQFGDIRNSLTTGFMVNAASGHQENGGSGWAYLTDVRSNASTYDIVALDSNNNVLGAATNHGAVASAYWAAPVGSENSTAVYAYFNDEMQIGEKTFVDFGMRRDDYTQHAKTGGISWGASPNQLAAGASSYMVDNWYGFGNPGQYLPAWDGSLANSHSHYMRTPYTLGASYLLTDSTAVYGRISEGFDGSIGGASGPLALKFQEMGVRYHNRVFNISADVFQATVKNWNLSDFRKDEAKTQFAAQYPQYSFNDASEYTDYKTPGVEFDANYRPFRSFGIDAQSTFQRPHISNTSVIASYVSNGNTVFVPVTGVNSYEGNVPERTPKVIYTVKPTYYFPENRGEMFAIYHYNGRIFADSANNISLPSCGRTEIGLSYNFSSKLNLTTTMDNVFNTFCLTEGNPRQGSSQHVIDGYFYGRSIPGRNVTAYLKYVL
jgi:outer membrane receptor protein involved in Fe transport